MFGRDKVAMLVAEFFGTAILATVVLSMMGRTSFPFFAAAAAGLTLGTMVLAVGPSSGSHLNPAITVGLWTMRRVQTLQAVAFIAVQMLGGVAAWKLNEYLLNDKLANRAGNDFDWRVLIAEGLGVLVFSFGVAAVVSRAYDGLQKAAGIGASLFIGILVGSIASNGILNPAVAVGVQSWSWAYALGPVVGAVVGMSLYGLVFADRPKRSARASVAKKSVSRKAPAKKKPAARKRK